MLSTLNDRAAGRESRPARSSFPSEEALIAEARQRQRQRWRRQGVLLATLVLLAAALAAAAGLSSRDARTQASGKTPVPPGSAAPMPPQIVVWTDNFKIEVLSAPTGRLIRTLATNVAVTRGLPTLAVSPAGVVYFDDARGPRDFVRSVPLSGGTVTTIAEGSDPALSPDGGLLAYWTYADPWALKPPVAIVVRDLAAGTQRTWAFTSYLPGITNLSWPPGGRFLSFAGTSEVKNDTVTVRTAHVLDTRSGGTLDGARPIPLSQRVAWAGYLTADTGIGLMIGPDGTIQTNRGLVEVAVSNGRILRPLTSLPAHGLGVTNAFDGTESTIAVDRSGRNLLIAGAGNGSGEIYRWTFGMRRPVPVTSGAGPAVWAG